MTMRMLIALLGAASLFAAAPAVAQPEREAPGRRSQPNDYVLLAPDARDGAELIGRRAPTWSFERWIRSPALTPQDLRGKVVLLRWWTEGCDFCAATLPGLEALRKRYGDDGLVIIGVYHPKPPRAVSDRDIVAMANRLGFKGPIAVDQRWTTLERYWLAGHEREFTSVSFLIDRDGVIRWVQKGGEYHPSADPKHARCDLEYRGLEKVLEGLLERG
jgi:thiol-disulfide isomerase/thioredoxin